MFVLIHTTKCEYFIPILNKGKIKSGSKTNASYFGEKKSDYIFLTLLSDNICTLLLPGIPFYLSTDILQNCPFWYSVGWPYPEKKDCTNNHIYIDPKKVSINKVLVKFEKEIIKHIQQFNKIIDNRTDLSNEVKNAMKKSTLMMNNQIIIKKDILLHKYLLAVPSPKLLCSFNKNDLHHINSIINAKYKKTILLNEIPQKASDVKILS